jgi:hypothetical protein
MLDASIDRAHAPMATFMREKVFLGLPPKEYVRSLFTKSNAVAALILLFGLPAMAARFIFGLGATTNLTQASPWGLWVAFDVVSGVALAAGGSRWPAPSTSSASSSTALCCGPRSSRVSSATCSSWWGSSSTSGSRGASPTSSSSRPERRP